MILPTFVLKLEKVRMKLLSVFVTYKIKTYSEQYDRLKIEIFIRIKEYSKVSCYHVIDTFTGKLSTPENSITQ